MQSEVKMSSLNGVKTNGEKSGKEVPFEEALTMTGFGKYNLIAFLLCSSLVIGMAFEAFSVSYLATASSCELQTSVVNQGLMAGMPLTGIIFTSHIWGYLADTRGRRKILCISLALGFSTGALATLSPNWIVLSVLKLLSASAVSGTFALSFTYLSENTPQKRRSFMIFMITSTFLIATALMAVVSIPILPLTFSYHIPFLNIYFNSWRLLNLVFSLPCAISSVGLYFAYESPKYLLSDGKHDEALEVLRAIYTINNNKDGKEFSVQSLVLGEEAGARNLGLWQSIKSQSLPLFRPPLLKRTLLMSALFGLIYFCANPYQVWMPWIVNNYMSSVMRGDTGITFCDMMRASQNQTETKEAGGCSLDQFAMMVVFVVGLFVGILNIFVSSIIIWTGKKNLLIGLQLLAGVAIFALNFSKIWILSGVLYIMYYSCCLNFGPLTAFSVDFFPTYLKAMAVCLTVMVGRATAIVGINILKILLVYNCEASLYIFGVISLVAAAIGFLLPSEAKAKTPKLPKEDCNT